MKAISNGYLSNLRKKEIDKYFDENEEFKLKHPNYKKWDWSLGDFEK